LKVVKPLRLSLIHRVFDHQKKHIMVMTVAYSFPFQKARAPVTEVEMWKMASTELGRFGVLDFWMFKPKAELLVTGNCYTGEREKGSEYVRVQLGPAEKRLIDKKLYVFGDRKWNMLGPSEPTMFSRMPVDYAHAFGGEKFPLNPIGKGLGNVKDESGADIHPLPNIEDPKHIIKSTGDRPTPAALSAWDLTWPAHFEKKMGTYDAKWVEKNGFALADDIDFSLFNVAPPDQRVDEFFSGTEDIRIENMHPDKRVVEAKLPGFKARCLVQFKAEHEKEQKFHDLQLRTDTIHLFPHHERAIVFMRGTLEIHTTDGTDVELVLAALEDDGAPKPLSHYEAVIAKRQDKDRGALYALRDGDLMPESAEISNSFGLKMGDALEDAVKSEGLLEDNQFARIRREYDLNRDRLLAGGIEPDKLPPPPPPPTRTADVDLEELPALVDRLEVERKHAEDVGKAQRAEAEALLESVCREHNLDINALKQKAKSDAIGPPKFTAEGELSRLRQLVELAEADGADGSAMRAKLSDANFRAQLLNAEQQHNMRYRLSAHSQEPAPAMDKAASDLARDELVLIARGAPRERRDFTGVDLSGADLAGIDLEGAFLEGANLKGANLKGAKLKDAVLAHANLEGAILIGADLERANLGKARLVGAAMNSAKLADAILYEADLSRAKLGGADLSKANTFDLICEGTDFTGAKAQNLFFYKTNLKGAIFRGAQFKLCVFIECDVTNIDARTSDFSQSVFLTSKGDGATFADSVLENLRIVNSSFERADFSNCRMPGSNLRGAKLAGSSFTGSNLRRSDVSTADFRGANLERCLFVECLMIDTVMEEAKVAGSNLMLSIMHRAILRGADVSNANLFCADLTGAIGDKKTSFAGSNVKRALVAGVYHG